MRKFAALGLVLLIAFSLVSVLAQDNVCITGDNATVVVAAGTDDADVALTAATIDSFMEACPNITVELYENRNLASNRTGVYQRLLSSESADVDVYMVNITSVGTFAEHLVDLSPYMGRDINVFFPAIVESNTVDGELKAIPWTADAGALYYRMDLLEKYGFDAPPITWNELTEMAQIIQDGERASGNDDFWGYVWQGNRYEGLTSNALEWQWAESGTLIIDASGNIDVTDPAFIAALERAARWVGSISPDEVLSFEEADTQEIFEAGNAAFMRDWTSIYQSLAENRRLDGMVGMTSLPFGEAGQSSATLDGWQLAVSKYSENPDAAAAVAMYLTNADSQQERAVLGTNNPTIMTLYEDDDVLDVFANGVTRPSTIAGSNYTQVSSQYFNAIHSVLAGEEDAYIAMELLTLYLEDIGTN